MPARLRTVPALSTPTVTIESIRAAQARLAGHVENTPCLHSRTLSEITGAEVYLKFENLQFTASFKERGALNKLTLLTPQQRWQLSTRDALLHPAVPCAGDDDDDSSWQISTPGPGPDEAAAESQEVERLQQAMAKLPAEQRLLLRLRYEQGLTLAEVARLTGQPDPFRTNRLIQSAVDALAALMGGQRPPGDRKT